MSKYTYRLSGPGVGRCPDYPANTLAECLTAAINEPGADCCTVTKTKDGSHAAMYRRDNSGKGDKWFRACNPF